jgi:Tol biopolymer transport system component
MVVTTLASGQKREIAVPKSLGAPDGGDWSPDGRRIALVGAIEAEGRWMQWLVDVDDGEWHQVLSDTVPLSRPRWSPAGDALYYLRGGDELRRIRIGRNGAGRGTPEVLYDRLGTTEFSISADGSMLVYPKRLNYSNLWLATTQRGSKRFAERQLTQGTTMKTRGRLSPDGRRIAFVQGEGDRADVFVVPVEGGEPQRVTSSGVALLAPPVWSPDGNRLAFVVQIVEGAEGLKLRTIALDGRDEHTYHRTDPSLNLAWAPQTRILYQQSGNQNFRWLDPVTEAETPLVSNDSVGWMFAPVLSPKLDFVAVLWNRRPAQRIYLISLRDGTQVPFGPPNAFPSAWSADGTSLYAVIEDQIWRLPVNGGAGNLAALDPFKKNADCGLTERGSGLMLSCAVEETVSDAWTIENFDRSLARTR